MPLIPGALGIQADSPGKAPVVEMNRRRKNDKTFFERERDRHRGDSKATWDAKIERRQCQDGP